MRKNEESDHQTMFNRNNYSINGGNGNNSQNNNNHSNWNRDYMRNQLSNLQSSEDDDELWPDWDAEFEDYAGISGPLYAVADAVFSFPTQKFFRRQVYCIFIYLIKLIKIGITSFKTDIVTFSWRCY